MVSETEILELMVHYERVNTKLKAFQQKPMDYGTGEEIAYPEIVLIKYVQNHPNKNISELAETLAITKGAISQTANKLVEKGYLRKFKYQDNKKEVFLKLTDKGMTVFKAVYSSYGPVIKAIIDALDDDPEKVASVRDFLTIMEKLLDERL